MQRHAVHCCGHAMLAHTVINIATLASVGMEHAHVRCQRVVGTCQISRTTDGFLHDRVDRSEDVFRRFACCNRWCSLADLLFQRADGRGQTLGRFACIDALEFVLLACGQVVETRVPFGMCSGTACAHCFPLRFDVGRHFERTKWRAVSFLCGFQLVGVGQCAVTFGRVLCGVAQCDMCLAGDHRRAGVLFGGCDGRINRLWIVTINGLHVPA